MGSRVKLFPDLIKAVGVADMVAADTLDLNGDEAEEAKVLRIFD